MARTGDTRTLRAPTCDSKLSRSACKQDAISMQISSARPPAPRRWPSGCRYICPQAMPARPRKRLWEGGRRGEHLHALAGLVLGRGGRWRHWRRVEQSHARAEPMRPLEALSPAVRLEAQLLSTFIKSATAPPSATASLYAVFVESAIAQSAFADSSIISSGLPAGNERGNQHAIRGGRSGGAQGAIRELACNERGHQHRGACLSEDCHQSGSLP